MEFQIISSFSKKKQADVCVIPFYKTSKGPQEAFELGSLKKAISAALATGDFQGKESELLWVYESVAGKSNEKRIALLGLGDKESLLPERLRRVYASLAKACKARNSKTLNLLVPKIKLLAPKELVKAIVEGLYFGSYRFDLLKSAPKKEDQTAALEKVFLVGCENSLTKVIESTKDVMQAVDFAKDLVNNNADDITPSQLAHTAIALSKKYPKLKTEVHDKKWIQKHGLGLLLAVSRASVHDPVFIIMKYEGNPSSSDRTLLVGKGITYDTGGLNLKQSGMETMKCDMAGSAAVIGTMKAIASLKLPVNVVAAIAVCENAIGSKAYKVGDVYKSYTGKTVEITNTDAEGRLTLADALAYGADHLKPKRIIDLATLTGSAVIALGTEVNALLSNDDDLANAILQAGDRTFERSCRLPLYEEYKEYLKSDIADIKNAATRFGGAILAAIFLQEFVRSIPWVHLDIAGTAYLQESHRYHAKYATGVGVRLLVDFFENLSKKGTKKEVIKNKKKK